MQGTHIQQDKRAIDDRKVPICSQVRLREWKYMVQQDLIEQDT